MQYDLIVIGDEKCGYDGAVAAAELNKRVALVEQHPGKLYPTRGADRAAALGRAMRTLMSWRGSAKRGTCGPVERAAGMRLLRRLLAEQFRAEVIRMRCSAARHAIDVYCGQAAFSAPHEVVVDQTGACQVIQGEKILLAVGTRAERFGDIPFDGNRVFDTDDIHALPSIPLSMIVVGGDRLGLDYAMLFAAMGVEVTLVERREEILGDRDRLTVKNVLSTCAGLGMKLKLGNEAIAFQCINESRIDVYLESGERLSAQTALISAQRRGATDTLRLEAAGLRPDERGRLWCDHSGRTWVDHIHAVGTVVGFPRFANAAVHAGRRAVHAAYGRLDPVCERINRRAQILAS